MGQGSWDSNRSHTRSKSLNYAGRSTSDVFAQREIHTALVPKNMMDPTGAKVRESRDSAEHPLSRAIIEGQDVTGSMGRIPHYLVADGLRHQMDALIAAGIQDPQILILGIGDHTCDEAPLQVSQFESNDELLDKWLTSLYIEGHGGGNDGESYHLAWYIAAFHTAIDCFEKRGLKGFLFTIGDEPVLSTLPAHNIEKLMGPGQYRNYTASELLEAARKKYHVFHVHVREGQNGMRQEVVGGWREILGDGLLIAEDHKKIPNIIADAIVKTIKLEKATVQAQPSKPAASASDVPSEEELESIANEEPEKPAKPGTPGTDPNIIL